MVNVKVIKFLDKYVLVIALVVVRFLKILDFRRPNEDINRVLFIRFWGMGDAICTLPTLKKLNEEGYKVDVLTTNEIKSIYNQPFIDTTYILEYKKPFSVFGLIRTLNKVKHHIVIDSEQFMNISTLIGLLLNPRYFVGYNHNIRGKMYKNPVIYYETDHFVNNFARLTTPIAINFKPDSLVPLSYNKEAEKRIDEMLKKFEGKTLIGMHMGSGGTAIGRRWDNFKFCDLANAITMAYPNTIIFFTGVKDEILLYRQIEEKLLLREDCVNLIGETTKDELIYLMTKFKLFIANDTGTMHMSACMGTKTVGLFGMNHPTIVGPFPLDKHICIYKNPNNNPIINTKYGRCPDDEYSTIDLIDTDDVYQEVRKCFEEKL